MKSQLELIIWEDTRGMSGWHFKDEVELEPIPCSSIGWVIGEDGSAITIAAHIGLIHPCSADPDDEVQFDGILSIPKRTIIKRVKFKFPETIRIPLGRQEEG